MGRHDEWRAIRRLADDLQQFALLGQQRRAGADRPVGDRLRLDRVPRLRQGVGGTADEAAEQLAARGEEGRALRLVVRFGLGQGDVDPLLGIACGRPQRTEGVQVERQLGGAAAAVRARGAVVAAAKFGGNAPLRQ